MDNYLIFKFEGRKKNSKWKIEFFSHPLSASLERYLIRILKLNSY